MYNKRIMLKFYRNGLRGEEITEMIEITYISNAGILIQYEKVRILVDALQDAGGYPFSGIPEEITDQMFCSDNHSMYNDIDFLVFTHNHPDHITPDLVEKYLKFNKVKRIIWPEETNPIFEPLNAWIKENGIRTWNIKMERGKLHEYKLTEDIKLYSLCTKHMKQIFPKDLCNCLMISIKDKNVLILSDCNPEEEELLKIFAQVHVDIVFINPYFYYDTGGRQMLERYIQPEKVGIYHIPFAKDDQMCIRTLAHQMLKKIIYSQGEVFLLEESGENIRI